MDLIKLGDCPVDYVGINDCIVTAHVYDGRKSKRSTLVSYTHHANAVSAVCKDELSMW